MSLITYLRNSLVSRSGQQASSLYASLFVSLLVSIAVSSINTHALGAEQFGDYKFLQNISTLCITFLTLGLFVSGGRLLAVAKDIQKRRCLLGGIIILVLTVYIVFTVILFTFSFYFDDVFGRNLGWLVRITLPLVLIYPLNICLENVLKGLNAIYSLATVRVLPNAIYLVYAYFMSKNNSLDLISAYLGYLSFSAMIFIGVLLYQKPLFEGLLQNIKQIYQETKFYGLHVYIGILASVGTMHFGGVMIAFYLDTKSAGFFLLARTITIPLTQISTTIGTTLFSKFVHRKNISPRVFTATVVLAVFLLLVFFVFLDGFVKWLYPPEFEVIIPLCHIMAIGATLQGIGGMINNFLCAQGQGLYSRNASFIRGAVNIFGYTVGIKYMGINGAAFTVLASGMVFLAAQMIYYKLLLTKADSC